ncbi:hypothetical protein EST38_g8856 [Candolleomyces aberdarensis]|uniref:Ricin B lectin domain-containing protein n=1 Tax=Candolleomyces aberdarensis TaxID=2316362 RepID=A0A4V1Q314_9AGAR|nr:hypothetical protein EST38_g8856 [Candolleomyces aberdarensis]
MIVGRQILTNLHYPNRVADLDIGRGEIIVYTRHGHANQIFNFHAIEDTQAQISIRINDKDLYAVSNNPSSGSNIQALEGSASLYDVHQRPNSVVKLSVKSSNGTALFWTLEGDALKTKVTLRPDTGNANQFWALSAPS